MQGLTDPYTSKNRMDGAPALQRGKARKSNNNNDNDREWRVQI